MNQRQVIERLLRFGPASRAELAKGLGLSAPTVGKVADELLAVGIAEELGRAARRVGDAAGAAAGLGRPARVLTLSRRALRFVAVQVGVRHTRVAALPVAGATAGAEPAWRVQFATPRTERAWRGRLAAAARRLRVPRPWAVVASIPGVVDEAAGRVLLSPNLHWTEKANVRGAIGRIWRAPVCLVQEIRALALGHLAAEPQCRDFLLVDFGQGVGGALVCDGRLYRAPLAISGELGHTPVLGNPRPCGCGAIGCVETLASRPGLLQSFAAACGQGRGAGVGRGSRGWRDLCRRVEVRGMEPWLGQAIDAAAMSIAGAINVLGVREVIVTGAMTELAPPVMQRMAQGVERSAMWARFGSVVCRAAPRRWAAGLAAAAIDRVLLPGGTESAAGSPLRRRGR